MEEPRVQNRTRGAWPLINRQLAGLQRIDSDFGGKQER
jgi:hypothetical protein